MESKLNTEDELKELMKADNTGVLDFNSYIDRMLDLFIDLIAERSEEKAEEAIDRHERNYDHNWRTQ